LHGPQESYCEQNNLWEEVFVSENGNQCEYAPGKTGTVVYGTDAVKTMDNGFEQGSRVTSKKYCLGTTEIVYNNNVQEISALYKLNETDGDGLKLLRAIMVPQGTRTDSSTGRTINVYWLMFVKDSLWIVNNTATSGWEDRTTEFYNSNMYKAFFLKQVDGFQLVYDNGGVLVYKRNAIAPDGVVEYPAPN